MRFDENGSTGDNPACGPIAADWARFASTLADHFFALQNRTDVHGRYKPLWMRTPHPKTGKVLPAYSVYTKLTTDALVNHFLGKCRGDLVGLHVSSQSETCKWTVIDFDAHGDGDDPEANWKMASSVFLATKSHGFDALLLDSNGKGGFHLWIHFARLVAMADAWRFGRWLVREYASFGLSRPPESFPKSPRLTGKRIGNWVRLPGLHHTRDHWTRVWDGERWLKGAPAIVAILAVTGKAIDLTAVIPADFDPLGKKLIPRRFNSALKMAEEPSKRHVHMAREALGHLGDEYRDDYDSWLRVGMALRQLDDHGLDLWHQWSEPSGKYRAEVLDQKWAGFAAGDNGLEGGQLTLGSLFYWARQEGWAGPPRRDRGIKLHRGSLVLSVLRHSEDKIKE